MPRMPPQNVSGYNTSSMSILVAFKPVPLVYQQGIEIPVCCQDGIITGYTIYYGRVDKSLVFQKTLTLHQLMNPNISSSSDETQANATLANGTMTISTLNETLCNTTLNASANLKGTFCNSTAQDGNEKAYVAVLNGLDPFKNYSIQIAGVTRKGPGVKSIPIVVITDEDSKFSSIII